jgi:hypothetical protein
MKAAAMGVEETLPDMLTGQPTLRDALYVAGMYERLAIGFLLINGMPELFFSYLFRAGRSFAHFLSVSGDDSKATAKARMPLFDAIACNDLPGALLISQRSRRTWNPDKEYEDDFLYVEFVMQKFFLAAGRPALAALLDRYEVVLEGAADFRLDACRAFLDGDPPRLERAIAALIDETEARLEKQRKAARLEPDEAATTAKVSIELLAWLRLAQESGFALAADYPLAPAFARLYQRAIFPAPDAWMTIVSFTDIT